MRLPPKPCGVEGAPKIMHSNGIPQKMQTYICRAFPGYPGAYFPRRMASWRNLTYCVGDEEGTHGSPSVRVWVTFTSTAFRKAQTAKTIHFHGTPRTMHFQGTPQNMHRQGATKTMPFEVPSKSCSLGVPPTPCIFKVSPKP